MSRIGKSPISVPSGVDINTSNDQVQVKGPKGVLSGSVPAGVRLELAGSTLNVHREIEDKPTRALHGLVRALVANMIHGVTEGFHKELEIEGVGYRAELAGKNLKLALGFSHPVEMEVPKALKVSVDKNTVVRVEGIDKELVGQFAADIRSLRPPEPYKGKGIRYSGERIRRKVGKAGAA